MVKLDRLLLEQSGDLATVSTVSLPGREIEKVTEDIQQCSNLTRLDLSRNRLTSLEVLSPLKSLKWLSVASNRVASLKGLQGLKSLTVLNCSKNNIVSMDELEKLKSLRALVLNDNQITTICKLDEATQLDTLVLSHNPIQKLGISLMKLSSLKKLSLSHCKIKEIGTSLMNCMALEELRLVQNQLKKLPKELEINSKLRIIDLGNNNISVWKDAQVLQQLKCLINLSLRGNPLADDPEYAEQVKNALPTLKIFDGRPTENNRRHQFLVSKKQKPDQQSHEVSQTERKPNRKRKRPDSEDGKAEKANSNVEDEEKKPFVELIDVESKAATNAVPTRDKQKNKNPGSGPPQSHQDSKVVSVTEKEKSKKHRKKVASGSALANALETAEIGTGGASSWDS